jgi:hypothetical protein
VPFIYFLYGGTSLRDTTPQDPYLDNIAIQKVTNIYFYRSDCFIFGSNKNIFFLSISFFFNNFARKKKKRKPQNIKLHYGKKSTQSKKETTHSKMTDPSSTNQNSMEDIDPVCLIENPNKKPEMVFDYGGLSMDKNEWSEEDLARFDSERIIATSLLYLHYDILGQREIEHAYAPFKPEGFSALRLAKIIRKDIQRAKEGKFRDARQITQDIGYDNLLLVRLKYIEPRHIDVEFKRM